MIHSSFCHLSLFCGVILCFAGCGIVPQTELQDASMLGEGRSAFSITPSPLLEARYQYGVTNWNDVSISGYTNLFVLLIKGYEGAVKLQSKQALTNQQSENNWAVFFSGQWYTTKYRYGGFPEGGGPTDEVEFRSLSPGVGIVYSRDVYFEPLKNVEPETPKRWLMDRFPWLNVKSIYGGIKLIWMQSDARYTNLALAATSVVNRSDLFVQPFVGIVAGNQWRFRFEIGTGVFINTYDHRPQWFPFPSMTIVYQLGAD